MIRLTMIPSHKRLPTYVLFLSLGALITFIILMASPSDPKNAVFMGYSLERIFLGFGVLIPAVTALLWTLNLFRHPNRSTHLWVLFTKNGAISNTILFFAFLVLLSGWVMTFLPFYRLGGGAEYIERLFPIISWLTITGVVTSVLILTERRNAAVWSFMSDRIILKTGTILFAFFIVLGLIVFSTGVGIYYPTDYWYGAGVPILGLQVLFSFLIGATILLSDPWLEKFNPVRLDFLLFLLIWVVSAWFWSRLPLSANYFMPDTANNVLYPYSDGATFDQGAQYALIGQGLFNGQYFDRSVYSVLLVYLHMFVGQDFEALMTAQAALFAVFPAVIYLLGRELHSRALGISAGILLALRGVNAIIAAKWIDTASPKMALTDFPTAIGISIFLLLLTKWIKQPSRYTFLLWAGAAFGLTLMIRTHALTLLPVSLIFIPVAMKLHWKQAILVALLVIMGLLAVTLPWEIRNQSRGIPMFYMYYYRIEIILFHRYGIGQETYVPSSVTDMEESYASNQIGEASVGTLLRLKVGDGPFCVSMLCSITNHFFHNTITSFVTLPSSFVFHDIWNIVKLDAPYWRQYWREGSIEVDGYVLIVVNLAFLSLGIGMLRKRNIALALLLIFIFSAYIFTNSLGFTSGGRYIAPVDWIIYIYYVAGGLQLIIWLLEMAGLIKQENKPANVMDMEIPGLQKEAYIRALPTLTAILAVGMLLPLSEVFFQPRYQVREPDAILEELEESGLLEQSGYSRDDLLVFLSHPDAMIREGRALYPRYYPSGEGEPDRSTYYRYLDYQRLVFTLIGPYSDTVEGVVIPGYPPPLSFHAADVVVIGCWNTTYYAPFIDSVIVFSTSDDGYVYNRSPGAPLQCPFAEP